MDKLSASKPTRLSGSLTPEHLCARALLTGHHATLQAVAPGLGDAVRVLIAASEDQAAEIERLKAEDEPLAEYKAMNWRLAKSQRELLAKSTALTARVEALEAALKPFAEAASSGETAGHPPFMFVGADDYAAARAALNPLPNPVEGGN